MKAFSKSRALVGMGYGVSLTLDQKTPWPGRGSLSRDDNRSSEKWAFAFCRARRSLSASRWKMNQLSPWERISAGMLPGCWVTRTAPRSYFRPSFTQEMNGPSPWLADDPRTDWASSTTAIVGTLRESFLVNSA